MQTSFSTKLLVGVLVLLVVSSVKSFATIERQYYGLASLARFQRKSTTKLEWSLPAPLVNTLGQNRRWYQDLGYPVDRRVEYSDDECSIWDPECGLGLVSSMSLLEDDTLVSLADETPQRKRRIGTRPLRMARGIWRRIRRNPP
jgi:hypothetical protein